MQQYLDLLRDIMDNGVDRSDRTGTGTRSVFGRQARYDLSKGFPCLTTKKLHLRSIIHELLWFLKGDTNIQYLHDNKVTIWDEWADENGDLGPVYGHQWRSCHCLFQFYVGGVGASGKRKLSCQLYQRSADMFLGVPFNIASYSLLTLMIAQVLDYEPAEFVHTFGDLHLYSNHFEQAKEQLSRTPRALPTMKMNPDVKNLFDFKFEDFSLENYDPWPTIKAPIAV